MATPDELFLTLVANHLLKSRGIDISGYSRNFVLRTIRRRVGRTGSADDSSYLRKLIRSHEETDELLGALAINVTDFFRDRGTFEAFTKEVIEPLLAARRIDGVPVRIWSAGCATGKETYTIAMCLAEAMESGSQRHMQGASILGTDISEQALAKAEAGTYTAEDIRGVPDRLLAKYFERRGTMFAVLPSVKRHVHFARENLLDPPGSRYFDAIVCRNVLIYFNREMREVVLRHLHSSLRERGYLMLGRAETLMGPSRSAFEVVDLENRILRRL